MDDYLEKLFAEAYRREIEQEETVIRSLPFIAAAAAIIVAVLREMASELPLWRWQFEPVWVHGLLILAGLSLVYTGWFVFQALRRRPFKYPRGESEIRALSVGLIAYHRRPGIAPEAAEAAALDDLRREMINQYAVCAENNRRQNEARQAARTQAFHGLMAAFLFVVALVGTTYIDSMVLGVRAHGEAAFGHGEAGTGNSAVHRDDESGPGAAEDDVRRGNEAAPQGATHGDQGVLGPGIEGRDQAP